MSKQTTKSTAENLPIPVEMIERRIFVFRDRKVMLDTDLADLYGVPTKVFNQAVKRNLDRFPSDFMFQLTAAEAAAIRSQFVTASRRNIRYRPYVFTEQGVAMLSSVLRSKRAVQVNILIMRAFVKLREALAGNKDLAEQIEAVKVQTGRNTAAILYIVKEIKKLKTAPKSKIRPIGFITEEQKK